MGVTLATLPDKFNNNLFEIFKVLCRPKNFGRHCLSIQKNCNPYFIVIMITVLIMNVIFWVVNFKTQNYFVISTTQNVYLRLSTIALILFIHVGFLEYLSFKQFKLIVEMTRIESGVTIPKGLFTLYLNVKKVTTKIFWPP
jgi:preprotein translocase subunit SecE